MEGNDASEQDAPDMAQDAGHELVGAVVLRVFYTVALGPYSSSPEFSTWDQAAAYTRGLSTAGEFGALVPAEILVEVRAEFELPHGRTAQYTVDTFTVTA